MNVLCEPKDGFYVWTKRGKPPAFHHATLASAQAEAERLAAKNPGAKFIVMAGVSKHSVAPTSSWPERGAGEAAAHPAPQEQGPAA